MATTKAGEVISPSQALGQSQSGWLESAMITYRTTGKTELDEVVDYWLSLPRASGHYDEDSLIRFLHIFTPSQIKGAMYIAQSKGRQSYFRYLCGVLNNWRRELEEGRTPPYFKID